MPLPYFRGLAAGCICANQLMVVRVLFVGVIGVIRGQKKDDIFSLRTSSEKDVILFFAFLIGKRCHLLAARFIAHFYINCCLFKTQ